MKRRRGHKAICLIANAGLAGMRLKKHESVSRRWAGPSHTVWSIEIDGIPIYRASKAACARMWMELLPK